MAALQGKRHSQLEGWEVEVLAEADMYREHLNLRVLFQREQMR